MTGVDAQIAAKLKALQEKPGSPGAYRIMVDRLVIPMMERVGLDVKVRRGDDKYTITVKFPVAGSI